MKFIAKKLPFGLKNNTCDGKYAQAGLDLYFGTVCPNNCEFCIAKTSNTLGESILPWNQKPDVNKILQSINEMCQKFGYKTHLSIHGGEPLMYMDELGYVLDNLPENIGDIRIQTSLPAICLKYPNKLINILKKRITKLMISIHHPDPDKNAEILKSKENHDRFEFIKYIKNELPNIMIEVNTVLIKDVFNKGDIEKLVLKSDDAKVDCLRLTEVRENENQYIPITNLIDIKYRSPWAHGCEIPVTASGIKYVKIMARVNCFRCNSKLYASITDLLKGIIKKIEWHLFHKFIRDYGVGIFPNGDTYNVDESLDLEKHINHIN